MASHIPENVIEDIQSRCDIAEVISGYIPLKRAGRNFKANCPFHQEKTPSFVVNPVKQIYHCFGCGEGGDVFTFVMKQEHIDFPEAVRQLARKTGVEIPEQDQRARGDAVISDQLIALHKLAAQYYQDQLSKPGGAASREYLKKRGITDETIKTFGLGCSSKLWNGFVSLAQQKGFSLSLINQSGLGIPRENGSSSFDRFRNRIMIPIFDSKDRIVGFGGRLLPEAAPDQDANDSQPKYMNSPETLLYRKSKILYGLNLSKEAIRDKDQVVIVEGYMDFLIPFQYGVRNVVASCGTSLTQEHIRLLKRYTNSMVIVYDPDMAGENAALRSLELFLEEDVYIKVARLPAGLDPDTYVRKNGAAAFEALIDGAQTLFDYKLSLLMKKHNDKSLRAKVAITTEMLQTISRVKNAIIKSEYMRMLSQVLSIDEEALRSELRNVKGSALRSYIEESVTRYESKASPAEKLLLGLMIDEGELMAKAKEQLDGNFFSDPMTRLVAGTLFEWHDVKKEISPSKLINHFNDDTVSKFISEMVSCLDGVEDKSRCFQDCIDKLKKDRVKSSLQALTEKIRQAEVSRDDDMVSRLLGEYSTLVKNQSKAQL